MSSLGCLFFSTSFKEVAFAACFEAAGSPQNACHGSLLTWTHHKKKKKPVLYFFLPSPMSNLVFHLHIINDAYSLTFQNMVSKWRLKIASSISPWVFNVIYYLLFIFSLSLGWRNPSWPTPALLLRDCFLKKQRFLYRLRVSYQT